MKAVVLEAVGTAENLIVKQVSVPEPGPDDVLVKVHACGVCYRDILDRTGKFPFIQLPIIPGHEFAGEVVETGSNAAGLQKGDRVVNLHRNPCGTCFPCLSEREMQCENAWANFGLTINGGYAEFVCAPASGFVKLLDSLSYEEGCILMCTTATALRALNHHARLKTGQTVLVTGATGGVGTQAVQLVRHFGASVFAVTTSPSKKAFLNSIGAEEVVVANKDGSFHKEIIKLTNGRGVDVCIEIVGCPTFNSSLRSLKPGGSLVLVGNVNAARVEINPGLVILKELHISGSDSSSRKDLQDAMELVASKKIKTFISEKLPLEKAAEAQIKLEQRKSLGRIVLKME